MQFDFGKNNNNLPAVIKKWQVAGLGL